MGPDGGGMHWRHEKFLVKLAVILHFNACSRSICICHNVYGSYGDYVDCGAKKKNAGSAIQAMNTTKNLQGSLSQDYRLSHIQEATHLKLFLSRFWAYNNSNGSNFCLWKLFPFTSVILVLNAAWLFYNLTFSNHRVISNVFSFVLEAQLIFK